MKIIIFAERFENGAWRDWERTCDDSEIAGVVDSARAKAFDRGSKTGEPIYLDYLHGAEYIFDAARGKRSSPAEEDLNVFGVAVDDIVIAEYERLKHYFELKKIA